jgi:hypothetical protein
MVNVTTLSPPRCIASRRTVLPSSNPVQWKTKGSEGNEGVGIWEGVRGKRRERGGKGEVRGGKSKQRKQRRRNPRE